MVVIVRGEGNRVVVSGYRLGVDFGTSTTVAFLSRPDGAVQQLLLDGWPVLPSAVYAASPVGLLVGRDALHAGRADPAGLEPNPKLRVDEEVVLLAGRDVRTADLIGAVLGRVLHEAHRVAGQPLASVTVTCPAGWGPRRRHVLVQAAQRAGAPRVELVAEPVAAGRYFLTSAGAHLPVGALALVYDLGAGTFDATVLRRTPAGFEVLASTGLPDAGGLDIDATLVAYLGGVYGGRDTQRWQRLVEPRTPEDRWARRQLWEDVRTAKELLSRASTAQVHIPLLDVQAPIGREQLDALAHPILHRTIVACRAVLRDAGVEPAQLAAVWLVGGATRMPQVATVLHRAFETAPAALEQPEFVVAQGSLAAEPGASAPAVVADRHTTPPPVPVPVGAPSVRNRRDRTLVLAAAGVALLLVVGLSTAAALWRHGGREGYIDGRDTAGSAPPIPTDGEDATSSAPPLSSNHLRATVSGRMLGHSDTVRSIAFSPDGKTLATGSDDETVRLWDVTTRQQRPDILMRHTDWVRAVAFSPDGTILATGGDDNITQIWEVSSGKTRGQPLRADDASIDAVAFSPDGKVLATGGGAQIVWRWDPATGQQVGAPIRHGDLVTGIAFSPDGRTLATSGCCASAILWHAESGTQIYRLTGHTERQTINAITFDRTGSTVATASDDGTIRLWDTGTGRPRGQPLTGHTNGVNTIAFSPDGTTLASGSSDGTVRLWDVTNGQLRREPLAGHTGDVTAVAFAPVGDVLASADTSGAVLLWKIG